MNFSQQVELFDPSSLRNLVKRKQILQCEVELLMGPRLFYENIKKKTLHIPLEQSISFNLTDIPNQLKVVDESRRMILFLLEKPSQTTLRHICGHVIDATFYLHVGRGHGLLSYHKDGCYGQTNIDEKRSYLVSQCEAQKFEFCIRNSGLMSVVIEILEPLPGEIIHPDEEFENFPLRIPRSIVSHAMSFLRGEMSLAEIRNRLIFIDTECAFTDGNKPTLLSITAIDYQGDILMNQRVCPRQYISNYVTQIHGFSEEDVICQEDSGVVADRVERMLRGRIIVGFDLRLEYQVLDIKLSRIAGIRDLQSSSALVFHMNSTETVWNLNDVTMKLEIGAQEEIHSSYNDATLIREVYRKIEAAWMDSSTEDIKDMRRKSRLDSMVTKNGSVDDLKPKTRLRICDKIRRETSKKAEIERHKRVDEARRFAEDVVEKRRQASAVESARIVTFTLPAIPARYLEAYQEAITHSPPDTTVLKELLDLVNVKSKFQRRKIVYKQNGGFIGSLIPLILSVLASTS